MIKLNDDVFNLLLRPYNLSQSDITFIGGGREDSDGIVYAYTNGNRQMVFKAVAWEEQAEAFAYSVRKYDERLRFFYFAGENSANIVYPKPAYDSKLYHTHHDGKYGYITYIMDRIPGRLVPPEEWNDAFYRRWGALIGKMHRLAKQFPLWQQSQQVDHQGRPLLGWLTEWENFCTLYDDENVKQMWVDVHSRLSIIPQNRDVFGFIHNDPHYLNIMDDGKTLYLIDFDVSNYHWFINDIAIALQSILFTYGGGMERPLSDREAVKRFLSGFMEGYEQEHHLDSQWLLKLDLFVAYRRMLLFGILKDMLSRNEQLRNTWKSLILDDPQYITECLCT